MLIEIQCGNFSGYDEAKREYVPCGEKIIVSGDQVGQWVECTKCHQQIEVPFGVGTTLRQGDPRTDSQPNSDQPGSKVAEAKSENTASKKARQSGVVGKKSRQSVKNANPRNKTKATASKKSRSLASQSAPKHSATGRTATRKLEQAGELFAEGDLALAAPIERVASDVMALDFESQDDSNTLAQDNNERCKKCGNISVSGRCTVCKHVETQFEKLHQPMHEIEIEPAGLQRWFCRTMNEGVSIRVLEYGAHIAFGILGFALICLAIISLLGFALGSVGGAVLLIAVLAVAGLYVGVVYKGHQFMRDPHAKLAWFQRPFWYLLLSISRAMNWQAYDKSLKGRKIITMREKLFGNNEISELPGIKNCQVLDLEGTRVTDQGLLELYHLNHLQCLVLRRTHVTHEAVFRLQQSCPRLWIWY